MSRPEAILFDFDGVLADTEPLHWKCWRDILEPLGLELNWDWYQANCIGLSEHSMLDILVRSSATPLTTEQLWPLYPNKKQSFAVRARTEEIISIELLDAIKGLRHSSLGVVTSSGKTEIEPILKRYDLLSRMSTCVYRNDVTALKPNPAPYLLAMERLGVKQAIVFEDSPAGIASASAAGCQVVRVKHPSELPQLLRSVVSEMAHPTVDGNGISCED